MKKLIFIILLGALAPFINVNAGTCNLKEVPPAIDTIHYFINDRIDCGNYNPPTIPVYVKGFNGIIKTQFAISFDTSIFNYPSIQFGSLTNFTITRAGNSGSILTLDFYWFDPNYKGVTIPDGSTVLTLKFNTISVYNTKLPITISNYPTVNNYTSTDSIQNGIYTYGTGGSYNLFNDTTKLNVSKSSICAGDSVLLKSNFTTNNIWDYDPSVNPSPSSFGTVIPNATGQTYYATSTGSYRLQNNNSTCGGKSSWVYISVNTIPPSPTITGYNNYPVRYICSGDSTLLSTSTTDPNSTNTTYQWFQNNNAILGATSSSYSASSNSSYSVAITNPSGCNSPKSANVNVTVVPKPATPTLTSTGSTSLCPVGIDTLKSSIGDYYNWYINGVSNTGFTTNQSLPVTDTGTYTVVTMTSNLQINLNCISGPSNPITITTGATSIPVITTNGPHSICPGGVIVLNATSGYSTYQWYLNDSAIIGGTQQSYSAFISGNYTVKCNTTGGKYCGGTSLPFNVSIANTPTPSINVSGNTTICSNDSVVLTGSSNNYTSYQWYLNGGILTGATYQTYSAKLSGVYTLKANNSSGCISSASSGIYITVNPSPNIPVITNSGSSNLCSGTSVDLTTGNANSYQWLNNGVSIPNATSYKYTANANGNYSVTVYNILGCKATSATTAITLINKTTPTITSSGNTSFCSGGNVQLNSSGYANYQWYLNGSAIPGANRSSFNAYQQGAYTVIGISTEGCTSNSSLPTQITVIGAPSTPVLTTNGLPTICQGAGVVLNASSTNATTYQWLYNGAPILTTNNSNYTAVYPGNYSVAANNNFGCLSSLSNTITVNAGNTTTPTINSIKSTICNGDSLLLTASSGSSYQWFFNGNIISNAIYQNYYATNNGSYTVSVTNQSGCAATSNSFILNVYPLPTAGISYNTTILCPGNSIILNSVTNNIISEQWYFNGALVASNSNNNYTASNPGNYFLIVTDKFGCKSAPSNPVIITTGIIPATPVITASGNTSICPGNNVTLSTANAYNNYQWYLNGNIINSALYSTYNAYTAGNYTVVVTNSNGCNSAASSPLTILQNPAAITPTISNSNSNNLCTGASLTLTASTAYSYQWLLNGINLNNGNNQTYLVNNGGIYTVVVSNNAGCKASASVTINQLIKTTPTLSASGNTAFCSGGNVQLVSSGYTSYDWYLNGNYLNSSTNPSIITSIAGNYSVIGTTSDGCTSYSSNTIPVTVYTNPNTPILSTSGNAVICSGSSLTLNSSAEFGYSWYLNGNLIYISNSPSYQATSAGNYAVKTTNTNGCTSSFSDTIKVTVNTPQIPSIIRAGNRTMCAGDSISLTSSTTGNSYQWFLNGSSLNNTATAQTIYAHSAGNYTVTVTYPTGCSATSANHIENVITIPTPIINYNSTSICPGGSITLSTPNNNSGYLWYLNNTPIINSNNNTYQAKVAGSYTIVEAGAYCLSAPSAPVILSMSSIPTTPIISASSSTSFCPGGSVILTGYNQNYAGYIWLKNGVQVNNGSTNSTFTANNSGNYALIAQNNNGCFSDTSAPITVNVYPVPNTPIITNSNNSTNLCAGANLFLTSSFTTGNQWSLNGALLQGVTTQSYQVNSGGIYSVTVTNSSGCTSSNSISINQVQKVTPVISLSGNGIICSGDSILLTSSGLATYQWYNNGNNILNNSGSSNIVKTTGNYTVSGITADGCPTYTSNPVSVSVVNKPDIPVLSAIGSTTVCAGNQVTLNSTIETTYSWFNNGTLINNTSSPYFSASASGNYTVVTTNLNGCTSTPSNPISVTINTPAIPVITIPAGIPLLCPGDSIQLTTNAGVSYQWNLNGNQLLNTNRQNIYASLTGSYTVNVTDPSGCSALSGIVNISSYNAPPTILSSNSNILCPGNTVQLSASPSYHYYQWFLNGKLIPSRYDDTLNASSPGVYTVIGNNLTYCSALLSTPVTITLGNAPTTPNIFASAISFCKGDSVLLTTAPGFQYQWFLNGNLINSSNSNNFYATQPGNYTVLITNSLGCQSKISVPVNIQQYPSVTPGIAASGSTSICAGNSVLLSTVSGNSYQWYLNNTPLTNGFNQFYSAGIAGIYYVKVIDAYGCSLVSNNISVNVSTVNPPAVGTIGTLNLCSGDSTELIASTGYNSYQWYKNGQIINDANNIYLFTNSPGSYTVTGTSANGCTSISSASSQVTVTALPPTPSINSSSSGICSGNNALLTCSPAGSSYQWYINGNPIIGANSQTFTAFTDGKYNVVTYGAMNCASLFSPNIILANYSTTPTIYSTGKLNYCSGDTTLLTASSGTNYQWYNNGVLIPGATSQYYIADSAGKYTVSVTNQYNCTSTSSSIIINVTGTNIPSLSAATSNLCIGTSTVLSTDPGYAYYHWNLNGQPIPNANTNSYSTQTQGIYTVYATSSSGCNTPSSNPFTINIVSPPAAPTIISQGSTTICTGTSDTLICSQAYSSYQWYYNNVAIPNQHNQNYLAINQGSYSVSVTDVNGCTSQASLPVNVSASPAPSIPTIIYSGADTVCNRTIINTVTASAYQWYINGNIIPGATKQNYTLDSSGTYTVQTSNSYNCTAISPARKINVKYGVTPSITIKGKIPACWQEGPILIADSGYASYIWYRNDTIYQNNDSRQTYAGEGKYYLVATANGQCAARATNPITVATYPQPVWPATSPSFPNGFVTLCKNSTLTLTDTSGQAFSNYQWYYNNFTNIDNAIPGANYPSYTLNKAGIYNLKVTDQHGCIWYSLNTIVNIDSSVASILTPAKNTFCKGDSVTLTATTGNSYQWYQNGNIINAATSRTFVAKTSGSYTVNVTDINSCRTTSGSDTITVNSSPAPSVYNTDATTYCSANTATALNGVPGYNIYQWYRNDTAINAANSSTYLPTVSGTYKLVAYNTGTCPSLPSSGINITIINTPAKPVLVSSNGTQICSGTNNLLISSAGPAYQWYRNGILLPGAVAPTYSVSNAGYYSVQFINSGCASVLSDSINIQRLVNPGFTINNVSQEVCTNNFIFTTTNPSTVNKYFWSFGDNSNASTLNSSHVYATQGFFIVKQIVSSPDNSCIDSFTQTISVKKCTYNGVVEEDSVTAYPNPTRGAFTVRFLSTTTRLVHMALIGENGVVFLAKDVNAVEGKNSVNFDLSSPLYKNGGYVITLLADGIRYNVARIILRH